MASLATMQAPARRLAAIALPGLALSALYIWMATRPGEIGGAPGAAALALWQLHPAVLVPLFVGAGAFLISAWIWSVQPDCAETTLFAFSGLCTLGFCYAAGAFMFAAPLPAATLAVLSAVNMVSAGLFGAAMIALFLRYPVRLPGWRALSWIVAGGFAAAALAASLSPWASPQAGQAVTFAEMCVIAGLVGWQMAASRGDAQKRAIAFWLGSTVLLGAGFFIATVAAPTTFGAQALILPHYAFASFLLIYAGLAAGLARLRIFDLGQWSLFLLFHAAALVAILALDLALVRVLAVEAGPALALALLAAAFVYLPVRGWVWQRLIPRPERDGMDLFEGVMDAALRPGPAAREEGWQALLQRTFAPLELAPCETSPPETRIEEDGLTLLVPAFRGQGALRLSKPGYGRRLFSSRDAALAERLAAMMARAGESRSAYDRGVQEERTRIARDLHDNIGAQMMKALHSADASRKDDMIRDTINDMRDIINNAHDEALPADLLLADLRAETTDRLDPHDMSLIWQLNGRVGEPLCPSLFHALRSVVREATSNAVKHSGAHCLSVRIDIGTEQLSCRIEDDGRGFDPSARGSGHGLANMRARTESLGGSFCLKSTPECETGARAGRSALSVRLPLADGEEARVLEPSNGHDVAAPAPPHSPTPTPAPSSPSAMLARVNGDGPRGLRALP